MDLSDDELALLHRALDLARAGSTAELAELVDAGLPVNLTGSQGDSLLMLATYHDHPEAVEALLSAGADPDGGGRSAREIAAFFDLDEMASLLATRQ